MRSIRILVAFPVLLFFLSCMQDNPLSNRAASQVSLNIVLPKVESPAGEGQSLNKTTAVTEVWLYVYADDMDDIEEILDISSDGTEASGSVEVPRGEARTFEIECYDANEILQYSGETTMDILEKTANVEIVTEGNYPSASTLTITSFDAVSVALSWTGNTDADFASYELVRAGTAEDIESSSTRESIVTITSKATTTYTDTSVTHNTIYYYAIIVWDTEGMGMRSTPVSVQTPQYFSALGPWAIPDDGWMYRYFLNNNFAPSGATVTNVEYRLRIDDTGDDYYFWCGDYEIYLSSSPSAEAVTDVLVYDNLGDWTDGGNDDDTDDDTDIYLNWRSTDYFNGENPNQYWGVYIIDNLLGDYGQLDYIEFRIYYVTPLGKPGVITMRVPASAAGEGVTLTGSHPSGGSQGNIEPISTEIVKIKSPAGR